MQLSKKYNATTLCHENSFSKSDFSKLHFFFHDFFVLMYLANKFWGTMVRQRSYQTLGETRSKFCVSILPLVALIIVLMKLDHRCIPYMVCFMNQLVNKLFQSVKSSASGIYEDDTTHLCFPLDESSFKI